MNRLVALGCLLLLLISSTSCREKDKPPAAERKLQVICTNFPLYEFARAIAGDKGEVSILLPPGMEVHSFEPKPDDLIRISKAGLFIYTNKAMEPWAADILKGFDKSRLIVLDASSGTRLRPAADHDEDEAVQEKSSPTRPAARHDHSSGIDPHIWLDFDNAKQMTANILAGLLRLDPANEAYYRRNAEDYQRRLDRLDQEFRQGLATCDSKVLLHGGHYTFGYLAARYGLTYIAATGITADAEPTPARMAALTKKIRQHKIKTIYTEELVSPRMAETLAAETGTRVALLHGAHNVSKAELARGTTFISIMEDNLRTLRSGLPCR